MKPEALMLTNPKTRDYLGWSDYHITFRIVDTRVIDFGVPVMLPGDHDETTFDRCKECCQTELHSAASLL